ncbi:beta galactosidase jelly roll domain-containing protein, partial [Ralstonia sp. 3N]|uniref:beta galactosidase jelly roll domain-containing protein n=1 Tax=Ralstonia sp. 3N TaxID=2675750 RepID=UPI0015C54FD4
RQVSQKRFVDSVSAMTDRAVRLDRAAPSLRVLRRELGEADVLMLVNESVRDTVRTTATVPRAGEVVAVDGFTGRLTGVPSTSDGRATRVGIDLAPGTAVVLVVGAPAAWDGLPVAPAVERGTAVPIERAWSVAIATAGEAAFSPWRELSGLRPLSDPDLLPRFAGTARYTATFGAEPDGLPHALDLGAVFELAAVRLNGVDLGRRIAPPYVFEVPEGVLGTTNTLEIDVTNTLAKAQPDFFSAFAQQEPSGL